MMNKTVGTRCAVTAPVVVLLAFVRLEITVHFVLLLFFFFLVNQTQTETTIFFV